MIHETKIASMSRLIETLENMAGVREDRIKGRKKSKVNPWIALNSVHDSGITFSSTFSLILVTENVQITKT